MPRGEWTDFNESDPGITLVALFAFLLLSLLFGRRLAQAISARATRGREHGDGP